MIYLKEFSNHSQYVNFSGSTEFIEPNVSICDQEGEIHYTPTRIYARYIEVEPRMWYIAPSGNTVQLTGTVYPPNADNKNIIWSVDEYYQNYLTVDGNGLVTSHEQSEYENQRVYTVDAETEDGRGRGRAAIAVTDNYVPITGVAVSPSSMTVNLGDLIEFEAVGKQVLPSNATFAWYSESFGTTNPNVLRLNHEFQAFEAVPGEAGISMGAEDIDGPHYAVCQVTVTNTPTPVVSTIGYEAEYMLRVNRASFTPKATKEVYDNETHIGSIQFSADVTSIGNYVFSMGMESPLLSVTIPDSVTSIGICAFINCRRLSAITLPLNLETIGSSCFNGCASLTSITIPSSVTSIGSSAFQDCSGLTSITCLATTPPTLEYDDAFGNTNDCPIYVPSGSVEAYKSAWFGYASRIQAIS